jgi:hypothetical protein
MPPGRDLLVMVVLCSADGGVGRLGPHTLRWAPTVRHLRIMEVQDD